MDTTVKRLYEAMFLVDSAEAADFEGIIEHISGVLGRSDVEIVSLKKWDERPLAYEVNKKTRGTYILAYFNADSEKIGDIERDVQLSERIMRVLILRADHITEEQVRQAEAVAEAEQLQPVEESGVDEQSGDEPAGVQGDGQEEQAD